MGVGGVRSLGEDSSIGAWIWQGTGTRDGARSWEGAGACREGAEAWEGVRTVNNVCDFADYSQDANRRDNAIMCVNDHRELVDFRQLTKEELAKI